MSTKLAIYVTGRPNFYGHKRREFIWSQEHGIYLYRGLVIAPEEFNEVYAKALKNNADMAPMVKVLSCEPEPARVTTVEPPSQITLKEAEEAIRRLAPSRLKKKPGRKRKRMPTQRAIVLS